MAKLILDTCSWLDLAKPRFNELFEELNNQVVDGITVLLTSNIIIEEWDRNRERIFGEVVDSIKTHAKSALKLADLLDNESRIALIDLVEKYRSIEKSQEFIAEKYISRVEYRLKHSTVYNISNDLKIQMADRALTKKAPFHNWDNGSAFDVQLIDYH